MTTEARIRGKDPHIINSDDRDPEDRDRKNWTADQAAWLAETSDLKNDAIDKYQRRVGQKSAFVIRPTRRRGMTPEQGKALMDALNPLPEAMRG
jgi:hypothetical protein